MSYSESQPPFMSPQPTYQSGSDAIGIWPQFPMNSNEQFDPQFDHHQPPFKRPRNSEDNNQSMNYRMPPPNNLPINKGTTNIFFKTRMCAKFKTGSCRNGENCNFAHGMQDMRQPPPNWQELVGVVVRGEEDRPAGNWDDDQRIIHKMKLCKKFYNGEQCPYGDRCNFLHEDPSKFRDDAGRFRESSAISIGTTAPPMMHGSGGLSVVEVNKPVNNAGADAYRGNMKPVYWKTKLCTKWETTGQCPFGEKCHFAHGQAELQIPNGRAEGEVGNAGSILTKPPPILVTNGSPSMTASVPSLVEERQGKKCFLKWKGFKKINRIYGDWLDDLPLVHNLTNQVES
ncbi:zinc finger CCCH domain-containing protein 39 [Ricinus communis]|uniref:C3H1-type domain-containing protein n=1 Tax=Ricinus communis TaxID=3988 RepID=B9SEP0_RICCO|nr:zinc finger CCCH domain-containing protein 39 [Ricinus communis]EEF37899.1 conserved hypothetical protein [Ricinus communis]|eukprot:XP_002524459.1 zinc finger CCCH domain-containing protein 39 [Ricinus communis]